MAKSYLSPDELQTGNKWLKTVFFPSIRQSTSDYVADSWRRSDVAAACKAIYSAIVDRLLDKNNALAVHFDTLENTEYYNDLVNKDRYSLKAKAIMRIFANVCAKREIFWDDAEYTAYELDYFKKTPFGEILWDFRCFVSQEPDVLKAPAAGTTRSTSRGNSATSTTPAAPRVPKGTGAGHTLYRNNAGGIVGTTKEILTGSEMYCILGEFNPKGKTTPKIHVSPQGQAAPLRVKYTSGQGHNDCILYFETQAAADTFKVKCEANLPSNVAFLKVKKLATDPNGYVPVDTQYGPAWIKASKLHEEIVEDAEDADLVEEVVTEEVEQLPESYYIEEYTKAAFALNELLD